MKSSVVQHREGAVVDKPTVGSGAAARNAAPHQNPSLQAHEAQGWGSKNDPRKKKTLKIGPLKTRGFLKMGFKIGLGGLRGSF